MAAARRALTHEEQDKYFSDANENVRKHAFYMQQSLDQENLHDALRHASQMINELRTSKLFPTRYYEVYMNVTNQLTHLQGYVEDEYKKKSQTDTNRANQWLKDLYDRVQYCGNIVPRLYLLITVGAVCIKVNKAEHGKVMEILFDLVSLSKGVQHATRGLFLRNYLSQVSRLLLPDVPEGVVVGNLDDHPIIKKSVEFVLQNFAEMTRLWVRMQHQGAVRDRARRERERLQLRMLVGTNLRRLSALAAISKDVYKNYALKQITDQVTKCKDRIAQEYLMECIIMVFSDDYHLSTLDEFLQAVNKLQPSVNVNAIIIKLMERLSKFAELSRENRMLFESRNVFEIFQQYCKKIIAKHKKMSLDDVLSLQVELVNFAAQCYPGKDEYIATMIKESTTHIREYVKSSNKSVLPSSSVQYVHRMLVSPLSAMNLKVLEIEEYCELINYLPSLADIRSSSADIVEALVSQNNIHLETPEQIDRLFAMIQPLLHDAQVDEDGNDKEEKKAEEYDIDDQFENEQYLMAKLIYLIDNKNTDTQFRTLHGARKYFGKGGEARLLHTFPPLVHNSLKLIQTTFHKLESLESKENSADAPPITVKPKKMFQFVHQICSAYGGHAPELGVRLWLQGGIEADKCGYSEICYEFFSQAFLCYEEHVSDSNEQYEAIRCIISYLQQVETLDDENFDTLRSKTTQHSNRLLKKPSAAKCYCLASHLYIDTKYQDYKHACKLLNKACKRASTMMDALEMTEIFVEVLNKYVYLLVNKATDDVEMEKVNGLIQLIEQKIKEASGSTEDANRLKDIKTFFRLTCQYITDLKESGDDDIASAFSGISV